MRTSSRSPEASGLAAAIAALRCSGGVVLYPTSTVYGIGGMATDDASVARVLALKGRSTGGLIVLAERAPLPTAISRVLAAAFWPGPLTLVVPPWPGLSPKLLGADGTVAVRPPCHPVAVALVAAVGPITSTSANLPGEPPVVEPSASPLSVDAAVNVGTLAPSRASTVVRADTGIVLREGAIPAREVAAALARAGLVP